LHFADWVLTASIDRLLLEILDVACKCLELTEAAIDALLPFAAFRKRPFKIANAAFTRVLFEGAAAAVQRDDRLQGLEVHTKWVNREAKA
jgi:hypothetical protein